MLFYPSCTLHPLRLDVDALASSPPLIELDLLKQHLAIDYTDLDELIQLNLQAAIAEFENSTHRTVVRRTHRWVLRDFPRDAFQRIDLCRGKTRAVQKVEVVVGGQTVTLTGPSSGSPGGSDYQEDLAGDDGGVLMPPRGGSWPSPDWDVPAPVTITFEAGWSADELPADIKRALLFWCRMGIDDERGSVDPTKLEANRATFEALVSGWRLIRWY
jgi:uncharacterized phiE125 gp8 family phage protein